MQSNISVSLLTYPLHPTDTRSPKFNHVSSIVALLTLFAHQKPTLLTVSVNDLSHIHYPLMFLFKFVGTRCIDGAKT
jgi:hypothetical protein